MSETMKQPIPPSPRQVLLGLFILGQLVFLILSNVFSAVKWTPSQTKSETRRLLNRLAPEVAEETGHVWQWGDQIETNLRRWTQLTGQDQDWALFTNVSKATGFPAVLLLWDEPVPTGPSLPGREPVFDAKNGFDFVKKETKEPQATPSELLLSENEPEDITNFLRLGNCRVRRYEGQLYLNPQPYDDESQNQLAERLTRRMRTLLTDYHDPALEYLKWRLKAWQSDNPDRPAPRQVVLLHRLYRIHGPTEATGWDGPYTIPLARWLPDARPDGPQVLEPFDFSNQRFVP